MLTLRLQGFLIATLHRPSGLSSTGSSAKEPCKGGVRPYRSGKLWAAPTPVEEGGGQPLERPATKREPLDRHTAKTKWPTGSSATEPCKGGVRPYRSGKPGVRLVAGLPGVSQNIILSEVELDHP